MSAASDYRIIGKGIYSLAEAARLTRVPAARIRRWTGGYQYVIEGDRHFSPPVIATEIAQEVGAPALTFADVLEVRFLDAFRRHGVSWRSIRIAAEHARELLGRHHPFSSRIFKTDGRTILADIVPHIGDPRLLDIVKNQYAFKEVVSPLLYKGVEFDANDLACRWWPLGESRHVVIDPSRRFGAPIEDESGVPTTILARAVRIEGDIALVARLYRTSEKGVRDADEYEADLARAA